MAWPVAFLYTQVAIVNNTKLSSPGEGKLPLKLAVIKMEPIQYFLQVKGCSKRNRWYFFEGIATVWNGVRQALRCLAITCLCMLSFLLNDFSQTEQNQLLSTSQEQSVDREKGRMLLIYTGLLLDIPSFTTTTFLNFLPPPLPPHFYCFLPPPPPPHFYFFPSSHSIKERKLPQLIHFVALSQVVKNNRGFLLLLAVCSAHQRQFLLRTATQQQLHA